MELETDVFYYTQVNVLLHEVICVLNVMISKESSASA